MMKRLVNIMKQQNLYLAVDIDGTLLKNNGTLSNFTKQYLNNIWDGNIIFVTGRNKNDALEIIDNFKKNNNIYVIFNDGQNIASIDKERIFSEIITFPYIEETFFRNFIDWSSKKSLDWIIYCENKTISVINSKNFIVYNLMKFLSRKSSTIFIHQKKLNTINIDEKIVKIAINGFNICSIDSVYNEFQNYFKDIVYSVKNDGMIEIKNKKATKLNALKYLLKLLKIDENNCIYIGNGGNDVSCLKYFKNSFAVANATIEAKNAANKITNSNEEDGVINALISIVGGKIQ